MKLRLNGPGKKNAGVQFVLKASKQYDAHYHPVTFLPPEQDFLQLFQLNSFSGIFHSESV